MAFIGMMVAGSATSVCRRSVGKNWMKTHNYGELIIVREEEEHQKSFSNHRKIELLEGRVKALEKKVDHLAYVVDRTF
jgi:hypothetical protein